MKSMTAFGRGEKTAEGRTVAVEIRTLNRRYLETAVRLPREFLQLEDPIKKTVAERISRGRVDVIVTVRSGTEVEREVEVNLPLARAYHKALCELGESLGMRDAVRLETLLSLEGIVTAAEAEKDVEAIWAVLSSCLNEALDALEAMRVSEGEAIQREFEQRLHQVATRLADIKELAPSVLAQCHDRLKERITLLTEGKVELDPARLAQEAAHLADKGDITEEIVRSESHLQQFRGMLESWGPTGRALDFLLQELNREVNTMGSKGGDAQIAHMVVELKSELEKIREQVQNVE